MAKYMQYDISALTPEEYKEYKERMNEIKQFDDYTGAVKDRKRYLLKLKSKRILEGILKSRKIKNL
jgi:hypothetical protein